MRIIAIIQARLGSTRLPEKVLLELLPGKNSLEGMIERVKMSKLSGKIIVATTNSPADKKLVKFLERIGQPYYAGDEQDVLDRYYQAAKAFGAKPDDVIVRLTGDCPVIDPEIIDLVIGRYLKGGYDFVSNSLAPYSYPDGMDVEVFSFKDLVKAWREAILPSQREHVTFYFWQNSQLFKIFYCQSPTNFSSYRLTLDYPEDYELLKAVYGNLYKNDHNFSMKDIIQYLDDNPEIKKINAAIVQNAGWQSAFEKDKKIQK